MVTQGELYSLLFIVQDGICYGCHLNCIQYQPNAIFFFTYALDRLYSVLQYSRPYVNPHLVRIWRVPCALELPLATVYMPSVWILLGHTRDGVIVCAAAMGEEKSVKY